MSTCTILGLFKQACYNIYERSIKLYERERTEGGLEEPGADGEGDEGRKGSSLEGDGEDDDEEKGTKGDDYIRREKCMNYCTML